MRICRLNTFSYSSMSPAVSSSPHSPTATHSAAANFSSIQHQLTFFTALGCTPQVWSTLMLPIDAGILVIHSSRKTELVTTASNPANSAEAWDSASSPSALSIVDFQPTCWRINSRWQCPSMATAPDNTPAEPSTSGAWRTCDLTSSGTSASRRIIVLQWRRAATPLGEGVATVSTVPLQYAANCFPRTSQLTDNVGSISWSHPFALTNSPNLSGAFPNCLARNTRMAFTDSHQVASLWSVNFPSSSWRFQCLFSRCRELHSAHWHFQQLFSGRKNHGRCIDSMCLRKSLRGTLQMSQVAVVPAVLSLVSFSTPALSSIVTTLLSSSVSLTAPAVPSSHTTTLASSRVLFSSSRTSSDLLLTSSIRTRTQRTAAESWCGRFWGAVLLLGDLPRWVTLTTAGDSRRTLLSPLDRLRERLLRDLTRGTPLHLTGDLLGDLALLGDVPRQPADGTLGSLRGALPGDLLMGSLHGDLPLQPADRLRPVSIRAGLPTDGEALLPRCLLHPHCRGRSAGLTASLLSPWKVTSRSSTNLEYRGSSSDDHYNTNQTRLRTSNLCNLLVPNTQCHNHKNYTSTMYNTL